MGSCNSAQGIGTAPNKDLRAMFVKTCDVIELKGSEPLKSQVKDKPELMSRNIAAQKSSFVSFAFYDTPSLRTVDFIEADIKKMKEYTPGEMLAPGKWGRTQMGSDGFNRILTGF